MDDQPDSNTTSPANPQNQPPSRPAGSLVLQDQILPPNLFVVPAHTTVIYPTLMAPFSVTLPRFVATVEEAINRQRLLGLILTRKNEPDPNVTPEDLYDMGVVVKILKRLKMP